MALNRLTIQNNNNISNGSSLDHEEEVEKIYAYGLRLANACTLPLALKTMVEMGVVQIIHDQSGSSGLSPSELAARIQAKNPDAPVMLDRILRLLATYSVVSCTVVPTADGGIERRYRPAPVTRMFVPDEDGVSVAPYMSLFTDKVFLESWSKLKEAVLEGGIPFDMVHGMNSFEYPIKDPRFNEVFNKAMYQSTMIIKKILRKYKGFENIQKLVDVGGGLGHTLRAITSQYPSIKGLNFDLPHVLATAAPCPGMDHVGGDMFESVPKGDAIFMKWILHDWSDDMCLKLLKNCYKALPKSGKVIVVETIVADEPEATDFDRAASQIDLTMLTQHPGGKERSMREFEVLVKAAGFTGIKLDCCVHSNSVMEFYK